MVPVSVSPTGLKVLWSRSRSRRWDLKYFGPDPGPVFKNRICQSRSRSRYWDEETVSFQPEIHLHFHLLQFFLDSTLLHYTYKIVLKFTSSKKATPAPSQLIALCSSLVWSLTIIFMPICLLCLAALKRISNNMLLKLNYSTANLVILSHKEWLLKQIRIKINNWKLNCP